MSHITHDTRHMTSDRWEEVNILLKFQLPSSYGLGVRGDIWHVTCDTWHMTRDMWHLTYDMCHVTHRGWWRVCQNFRSLAPTVWVSWRFWTKGWPTQFVNYKGDCRTAPATPGLLNIQYFFVKCIANLSLLQIFIIIILENNLVAFSNMVLDRLWLNK